MAERIAPTPPVELRTAAPLNTRYVWVISIIAALGGLLFGYDFVVIGGATFPVLNKNFGSAITFWLYAAFCVLGFVFIKLRLPETTGKTLEEIEKELLKEPS